MRRQISAGIITYHTQNKIINYLILHYPGGHWDFPKGKIEEGETKQKTALRELKEETGLEAEIIPGFEDHIDYFFRAEGELFSKTVSFFLGKVEKTEIVLSHEHRDYGWFDYEKAYQRITYQNSKNVLERAHQFLKEMMY